MKVYRLDADVNSYQNLRLEPTGGLYELSRRFNGNSIGDSLINVKIKVEQLERPKGDFPSFLISNIPIFSRSAMEVLGDLLEGNGEVLPVLCDGEEHFCFNVTRVVDALDESSCEALRFTDGRIMRVVRYSFLGDRLDGMVIFKVPQLLIHGAFVTDPFVERVTSAGLKGFKFPLVWKDGQPQDLSESIEREDQFSIGPVLHPGRDVEREPIDKRRIQSYQLKQQALERVLGNMYEFVRHAIVPFEMGGAVDMYCFPLAMSGTGFATMELIRPDGSGPLPSRIGTYELVAFTKHKVGDEQDKIPFEGILDRTCGIFTSLGNYSYQAQLNPLETVEVPVGTGEPNRCVILDEYETAGAEFTIGNHRHGLLLVIEIFRSEMEYARQHGAAVVLERLKEEGYYPYSDLDREPVF